MNEMGMLKIGASRFVYGKGAIQQLPEEILRFGKKAFLVGGRTTLPMVREMVERKNSGPGHRDRVGTHG